MATEYFSIHRRNVCVYIYINIPGRWAAWASFVRDWITCGIKSIVETSVFYYETLSRFFSVGEKGGKKKKKKKKRTAINFCNVIKINRDVALTNVRECDVTQIFISSNTGLFYATRKMKWVVHPRVDCDCLHATTTGKVYRYQGQTLPTEQQKSQISRTKSSIIS